MTITLLELTFYCIGLFILFLTPGPVWVALVARTLSGGFAQAWSLTLGVAVGDVFWSVLAIMGVGWAVGTYADLMSVLRIIAAVLFVGLGLSIIRAAGREIGTDSRLTRKGTWAGFVAGLIVILSNPKAVLFYMGVLPGFFDLSTLTGLDIAAIATASFMVPLVGNLGLAVFVDRVRRVLTSPRAVRRMNLSAGGLLITVGLVIPFL